MVTGWKTATVKETSTIFGRIGFRGYTKEDIVDAYEGAISLSPSNLKDGKVDITNSTFISWDKYNESPEIKLQDGDVVLVKTGSTYGKSAYVDNLKWATTLNPQIVVFKNVKINKKLFAYFVQTPEFQKQIEATIVGGAIPTLSQNQVYQFEITFPIDVGEQQRIAEALSDVDELISSLEKLIEKYKSIKATCLQQMFPQKGETTPKMRLPGFTGAWEQCKFSEVYSFASEGGTPDTNTAAYYRNGTIPFVRIEDTENKYIDSVKTFITEEGLKHSSAWLIPSGSVIFTNGATVGNVAINHIPVATKQGILGIIPNKTVTAEYLYYLLSSGFFQREVRNRQATGTFATIILKNLNEINVFVPDKAEQQKISGYLSSIDNLITLHQLKLDKAKKIKQGMMQQLLTGKIRLV